MKVAVFGSSGQLGKCFQDLQELNTGRHYHFYEKSQLDISDPGSVQLLDPNEIDVLLNCAAYTKVDQAEVEKEKAYNVNVLGSKILADFGEKHSIPLIQISTDYVYKSAMEPIRESHAIEPINYYGKTKWEGEEAIRKSGVNSIIIRTSWLYSQYGHNFVKTMLRLAKTHSEIKVVNDQIGSPTYAADLARAIDCVIHDVKDLKAFPWGTYNFANHGEVSWYEFACEILKDNEVKVLPIFSSEYPTPAARPVYSVLDVSKFEDVFGWRIPEWRDGLTRCMEMI